MSFLVQSEERIGMELEDVCKVLEIAQAQDLDGPYVQKYA